MKVQSLHSQNQVNQALAAKALGSKKNEKSRTQKQNVPARAEASQVHLSKELAKEADPSIKNLEKQEEKVKAHQEQEIAKIQAELRESLSESGFEVRLAGMKEGDMSLEIVDRSGHVVAKIPPKEAFEIVREISEKNKSSQLEGRILNTKN